MKSKRIALAIPISSIIALILILSVIDFSRDRISANASYSGAPASSTATNPAYPIAVGAQLGTPCTPPPANLISWWPGDGDATDIQDGNDGTLENGATFAAGMVDQGFSFDGVDDHVSIGNPANLQITGDLTLDAWIQLGTGTGVQAIVTKWGQSVAADSYAIWTINNGGTVQLLGAIGDGVTQDNGIMGGTITVGAFTHVAMTYDSATGTNTLYVNGVQVATRTRAGGIHNAGQNVLIGREDSILPRPFNGIVDEVEIFNRALADTEILALFNAGSAGKCKCLGIICPEDVVQGNDPGQCGAVVTFADPTPVGSGCGTITCTPASGSFFPVGTTTVTCMEDATNASCSFTVTVNDVEPPVITCPVNITTGNDPGQCGAVVNFAATATDNCDGKIMPNCMPAPGSFFPIGTTTVTCTATDAAGNTAQCNFTVTVNDVEPPVITCPNNIIAVTANVGAPCVVVNFAPVVSDNCPGVTFVCNPPSGTCFPTGTTTVTCTATDASGNTAQCSFTVSTFDVCIEDDSNPGNVLLFVSTGPAKGSYLICCGGVTLTGVGTVGMKNGTLNLIHFTNTRRVQGFLYMNQQKGSAALQVPPSQLLPCTINDSDTTNNSCNCSPPE